MQPYGIHWFRRDLRIAGNSALKWNWRKTQGKTLGIFFLDSKFLARPDFSHHRFGFFLQTLKTLKNELKEMGGDLIVLDRPPKEGFEWLFSKLRPKLPAYLSFNRDYEPFARERDALIQQSLSDQVQIHTERDHLVIEPHELRKEISDNSFYQVYTPFSKKWFSLLQSEIIQERIQIQQEAIQYLEKRAQGQIIPPFFQITWSQLLPNDLLQDSLDAYIHQNKYDLTFEIPQAGSLAAYQKAKSFLLKVDRYLETRDYPYAQGNSQLSVYLKNGSMTPAILIKLFELSSVDFKQKTGRSQFLKELIWREFYYHIIYNRPRVENESFLPQYKNLRWENREDWFQAWQEGKTGYPIVDAGMRELKTTGLMHNRVRMIVASFLTKDLLIDWRWGEKHFMNHLLDGDLAANNGGWQWAASTGSDPQPYFRIFNPTLQAEKFDPQGHYIRQFLPELETVSTEGIHSLTNYLPPIVDHSTQKQKAIALYQSHKKR